MRAILPWVQKLYPYLKPLVKVHARLDRMEELLRAIHAQGVTLNSDVEAIMAALVEANDITTEIANDIDALVGGLGQHPTTEEVKNVRVAVSALAERLRSVAAAYTPPAPTE